MLTDNEVKKTSEDTLNYGIYADTLAEIIVTSQTPITIGVYAEWGFGKTSLMRLTEDALHTQESSTLKSVWFNAWKFDKSNDLRVAIINVILKQIEKDRTTTESIKEKAKKLLKRINWLGLGSATATAGAVALNPYLAAIPILSGVFETKKLDTSKFVTEDIIKDSPEEKALELIGEFEDKFKELTNEYVGNDGRLVIFIDDLDRCLPDKAIDILESIKLFLNVPNTVFVIGVDKKVIESGILKKYGKEFEEWGKNYLDKIIQVQFRLPPISMNDITDSFIQRLEIDSEIKEYAQMIALIGDNPRTIKRLLNNINIQKILASKRKIEINITLLVKFNILEYKWPEFYTELTESYTQTGKCELLNFLDEYDTADEEEKENKLKNRESSRKYALDNKLLEFLRAEPDLYVQNLENYIFLSHSTRKEEDPNSYFDLGYSSYENKDFEKAIEYNTKAIMLYTQKGQLDSQLGLTYYNRGLAYTQKGEAQKAIRDFTKAINLMPDYINAYSWRGYCYANYTANYQNAIVDLTKVIELEPANAVYKDRAFSYSKLGKFEESIKDYSKAIELDPNDFQSYYERALSYVDIKEYDKSIEDNTKAITLNPNLTDAYINRGLTYDYKKDFLSAMKDYMKAMELSTNPELVYKNVRFLLEDEILKDKIMFPDGWAELNCTDRIKDSNLSEVQKKRLIELLQKIEGN